MGKVNIMRDCINGRVLTKGDIRCAIDDRTEDLEEYESSPLDQRTREEDDEISHMKGYIYNLYKYIKSGPTLGDIEEGYDCDTYRHYVDIPVEPEELREPLHSYPKLKDNYVGEVFNRRSALLSIRWGNVKGIPILRVTIKRVMGRDEEDETLVNFDISVHAVNGHMLRPKQYVFQALNKAKKQFSEKVGCVVCGKPDIWFKKIKTPQYPLYQVMWKEVDFADTDNRICRECYKMTNPTVSDFDPHPEQDPETSIEEIVAAYNLNKYTGKEWYLQDKGEGFVSAVNETVEMHGHIRLDSIDYMAAVDRQLSITQLGG